DISTGGVVEVGDVIRITLDADVDKYNSPSGRYSIKDILPSGFRYIQNPNRYGYSTYSWMSNPADQVYKNSFYNSWWWHQNDRSKIFYYVCNAHVGEYLAEPAKVQSDND